MIEEPGWFSGMRSDWQASTSGNTEDLKRSRSELVKLDGGPPNSILRVLCTGIIIQ